MGQTWLSRPHPAPKLIFSIFLNFSPGDVSNLTQPIPNPTLEYFYAFFQILIFFLFISAYFVSIDIGMDPTFPLNIFNIQGVYIEVCQGITLLNIEFTNNMWNQAYVGVQYYWTFDISCKKS